MNVDMQNAYIAGLASGGITEVPTGLELNIGYGTAAPADTSKLWVKTAEPENVTVDYDINNGVESIQQLTTTLPTGLSSVVCGVVGTKCYIFGGWGTGVYEFDSLTNTVTTLPVTWPAQLGAVMNSCGVVGTKCYVFGGGSISAKRNDIYEYDTTTGVLTKKTTTLPTTTVDICVGVVGTKCYLFGGVGQYTTYYKRIDVYDTETDTITTLSSTLPISAGCISCGVVDTDIYLFGGHNSNTLNTISKFDTTNNTITTLPTVLPTALTATTCYTVGTKCYIFGGTGVHDSSVDTVNTIYMFDARTETITLLESNLPVNTSYACGGGIGNNYYLFGGIGSGNNGKTVNKFTITFPLPENDIYIQEDTLKNQFTLISEPTKVVTGVSNVYVGNSNNEAEKCEAYLHDGTDWQEI